MYGTIKHPPILANYHSDELYYDKIWYAYRDVVALLRKHCGPHATNAILPTQVGGGRVMDQFSKDGINLVNALKTKGALHQHALRLVSYVGERVDNACHDGTTTAMMLFCDISSRLIKTIEQAGDDAPYRRHFLRKALVVFLDECEAVLQQSTLTVDDFIKQFRTTQEQAVWAIAYHQANIASKGDTELAHKLAELLSTLPVDLHGQYVLHTSGMETDERFILKQHDHDFELPGMVANVEDLNHAMRSELRLDDAVLVVTPNNLVRGNPEAEHLLQLIAPSTGEHATDRSPIPALGDVLTKPLVILTPELNDPQLYEEIKKHNVKYPSKKVIVIHMQVGTAAKMFADAICATANALPLQMVMQSEASRAFIDAVGIEQRGTRVYIKNLYAKTGEMHHPAYVDPLLNPFYTKIITELKVFIANATSRLDPRKGSERMLEFAINCYRFMASQTLVDLSIGGSSHEYVANLSVAQDAQGAAVSAIRDGVVLGGHQRLLAHVITELRALLKGVTDIETLNAPRRARYDLLMAFGVSLVDTLNTIYYPDLDTVLVLSAVDLIDAATDFVEDYENHVGQDRRWYFLEAGVTDGSEPIVQDSSTNGEDFVITAQFLPAVPGFITGDTEGSVLLQPLVGYREFFRRLRELLPKLINTTSLIDIFYVDEKG